MMYFVKDKDGRIHEVEEQSDSTYGTRYAIYDYPCRMDGRDFVTEWGMRLKIVGSTH
jgi:hypothetical protein